MVNWIVAMAAVIITTLDSAAEAQPGSVQKHTAYCVYEREAAYPIIFLLQ